MGRTKKIGGVCNICGQKKALSREHIPPKSAFNDSTVLYKEINLEKSVREIKWKKGGTRQGGYFQYVLCGKCNNDTGAWYVPYYVNFIRVCADYATLANAEKIVELEIRDCYPLRIIKEALTIICASSGPSLIKEFPLITQLIRNKYKHDFPKTLQVYVYLRCHSGMRTTGQAKIVNLERGKVSVVAEHSFWPLGWILTFEKYSDIKGYDVTHWFNFNYGDKKTLSLALPCHHAITPYPLDFRNQQQIKAQRNGKK